MGLLVTTMDGRPVKIEGNPDHPASRGGTSAFAQARPNPRLEAQTIALRPAIPRSISHFPIVSSRSIIQAQLAAASPIWMR